MTAIAPFTAALCTVMAVLSFAVVIAAAFARNADNENRMTIQTIGWLIAAALFALVAK